MCALKIAQHSRGKDKEESKGIHQLRLTLYVYIHIVKIYNLNLYEIPKKKTRSTHTIQDVIYYFFPQTYAD